MISFNSSALTCSARCYQLHSHSVPISPRITEAVDIACNDDEEMVSCRTSNPGEPAHLLSPAMLKMAALSMFPVPTKLCPSYQPCPVVTSHVHMPSTMCLHSNPCSPGIDVCYCHIMLVMRLEGRGVRRGLPCHDMMYVFLSGRCMHKEVECRGDDSVEDFR